MTRLYLDIETFSSTDLKAAGVYRYTEDPTFRILMCAWAVDDGPVEVAISRDEIEAIPHLYDPEITKVAHNAQFERVCFSRFDGMSTGTYRAPEEWHDTQAIAAEFGYPQKLELLARTLGGEQKDSAGTRLINLFCKPNRQGRRVLPEEKPEDWNAFVEYCRQDAVTLRDVDRALGDWPTPAERELWYVDQRINDHGIDIDVEMAQVAVKVADDNRMVQELEIMHLTGVYNPGSQPQMMAWVKDSGLKLRNLQAGTIEVALEGTLTDVQRRVLTLRQELALTASKKYTAALERVCVDGRLRGSFRFFGAHTGRWTGSGVQLQNLPRASLENETATMAAICDLKMGAGVDAHTLKALVRALFCGPFTVLDYSSIEARVLAWLANEQWALDAFAIGRDIYVETAQRMGDLTRAQGKVAVLALGYNGAINSLRAMGAEGNDQELQFLVDQWRLANRNIVRLWRQMEDAIEIGGQVGDRLRIDRRGPDMLMRLPSGRSIVYHNVKWERYVVIDPRTGKKLFKEGWRYSDPKGAGRIGTYGGRLVENATQAVARDLLAEALVRLWKRGYRVAAHVHDEAVIEGEHSLELVAKIMSESPTWADGLPVEAAGYTCLRYRKG